MRRSLATLTLGTVAFEPERAVLGPAASQSRQAGAAITDDLRSPGESYSDVILRLAEGVEQN